MLNKLKRYFSTRLNTRSWSGNDKHWGPFTYSLCNGSGGFGFSLNSADPANKRDQAHFRLHFGKRVFILELGQLIVPKPVDSLKWLNVPDDKPQPLAKRSYELTFNNTSVFLKYGVNPEGWSHKNKSKLYRYPWKIRRHMASKWYDRNNDKVVAEIDTYNVHWTAFTAELRKAEEISGKEATYFEVEDYDGELIHLKATVFEDVWKLGDDWFKWLSVFVKIPNKRNLLLRTESELGVGKGSWKGGWTATSIEIDENELPEVALKRWCDAAQAVPNNERDHCQHLYLKFVKKLDVTSDAK